MFCDCVRLKLLDLSNFVTESVKSMRGMFEGWSNLINLICDKFDTSNVSHMSDMFSGCKSIENLDLSKFKRKILLTFQICSKIATI